MHKKQHKLNLLKEVGEVLYVLVSLPRFKMQNKKIIESNLKNYCPDIYYSDWNYYPYWLESVFEINPSRIRDITNYCEKNNLNSKETITLIDNFITLYSDLKSQKWNDKMLENVISNVRYLSFLFNIDLSYNVLTDMETQKFLKNILEKSIKNGETNYINLMANGFKSFFKGENHYNNYYVEIPYFPCFQPLEYDMLDNLVEDLLTNIYEICREEYNI